MTLSVSSPLLSSIGPHRLSREPDGDSLALVRRRSDQTDLNQMLLEGGAAGSLPAVLTGPEEGSQVQSALGLTLSGKPEEEAARSLKWRDFERFCAELFRAGGYTVEENIYLKRPRAQIDLVGTGPLCIITLDCKHWKRAPSPSALQAIASAQLRRSHLLRRNLNDPRPIVSAIVALSESEGRFMGGVAIVPLRAFRNFLVSVESYSDLLKLA